MVDSKSCNWMLIGCYEESYFLPKIYVGDLVYSFGKDNKHHELLDSVLLVKAESENLKSILISRNKHYSDYIEKMQCYKKEHPSQENFSEDELRKIIGLDSVIQLEDLTIRLVNTVSNIQESCKDAKSKISRFLDSKTEH